MQHITTRRTTTTRRASSPIPGVSLQVKKDPGFLKEEACLLKALFES